MNLSMWDVGIFVVFFGFVAVFSMYKSRREETGEDFFLAGRGLTWPLIGFSLIAANISSGKIKGTWDRFFVDIDFWVCILRLLCHERSEKLLGVIFITHSTAPTPHRSPVFLTETDLR